MKKTLVALAAALAISSTPAMAYHVAHEEFTANLPSGYMLLFTTAKCQISMKSPVDIPLHAAMAVAYRRVYRGCWYTEPKVDWFRARLIGATPGWEYLPKDIFLEQKNDLPDDNGNHHPRNP